MTGELCVVRVGAFLDRVLILGGTTTGQLLVLRRNGSVLRSIMMGSPISDIAFGQDGNVVVGSSSRVLAIRLTRFLFSLDEGK